MRAAARKVVLELCAETLEACAAAREGGADRVELCSALSEGGTTPSIGLVRAAVRLSGLPVHAMVRPRGGDFCYSADEFDVMIADIEEFKSAGAAGVVCGVLRADGWVDVERTAELVRRARPMEVTFHRAFDKLDGGTAGLMEGLEAVIRTGCDRLLTSGGAEDVFAGAEVLAELAKRANGRIEIAVGAGLRWANAANVARRTGAKHFHGSMRRPGRAGVEAADIRAMRLALESGD